MIPMRDGTRLYTAIYAPTDGLEHPIVMQRTPYSVGNYGETEFEDLNGRFFAPYSRSHYIIVMQDIRGRHHSEGKFEHIRPLRSDLDGHDPATSERIDEATDTYDTIDWLLSHTHNNGNVGITGTSYLGFYAAQAALCGHPALKAVSPQAPICDWVNGDDLRHNGALFLYLNFSFCWGIQHGWDREEDPTHLPLLGDDIYWSYLSIGPTRNFTWRLGKSSDLWNMVVEHPNYDKFWHERALQPHLQNVRPAMLVVGGLFDAEDPWGVIRVYQALRLQSPATQTSLVLGPWSHGQWNTPAEGRLGDLYFGNEATAEHFINHIEFPFFAHYLESEGGHYPHYQSGAHVFFTGENRWHFYPAGWGPRTKAKRYYLKAGHKMDSDEKYQDFSPVVTSYEAHPQHPIPYIGEKTVSIKPEYMCADQRFMSERSDIAVFRTETLEKDLRVAGEVDLEFFVSLTTSDADFIVKIIDVYPQHEKGYIENPFTDERLHRGYHPEFLQKEGDIYPPEAYEKFSDLPRNLDGYQQLVRWEVLRGKYRNSQEHPQPFIPDCPERISFRMPDMAHVFRKGHRIMIIVQSTMFPLIDINPQTFCNIYEADEEQFQPTTVSLFHCREYPSRVILPVIE